MLPLKAIGGLGILYCFFMYGTLRAIRAKRTVRPKARAAAMDTVPETATPPPS